MAAASQAADQEVLRRLAEGTLLTGFPSVRDPLQIGIGQSMGGCMTVIQQDSADKYRVLENAPTHFGGHSLVIDPVTHRIYVAYFGSIAVYDALPQP